MNQYIKTTEEMLEFIDYMHPEHLEISNNAFNKLITKIDTMKLFFHKYSKNIWAISLFQIENTDKCFIIVTGTVNLIENRMIFETL